MPNGAEAPATTTAEGPTQHTPNQAPAFSPYQLRMLHGAINPNRVQNLRGMAHLEAWDVRRQLIRIFGFGGFSIETLALDLVHNHGEEGFRRKNKQGEEYGAPFTAWTVVYRAQVRLTVFDTSGRKISHWEDGAAGDAVNQPSVGDAHDMAMKTAFSQALKRCAVNLGDQFGLSLYNDASRDAVVMFSAAHPPQEWQQQAAPPQPEPDDPPVQPEPEPATTEPDTGASQAEPQHSRPAEAQAAGEPEPLEALMDKVRAGWKNALAMRQNLFDAKKHGVADVNVPSKNGPVKFGDLIQSRIDELERQPEGSAA